jgi:hypothetical protein
MLDLKTHKVLSLNVYQYLTNFFKQTACWTVIFATVSVTVLPFPDIRNGIRVGYTTKWI